MGFELDEKKLEELRKFLEEDIVTSNFPSALESAESDGVDDVKKSGTASPLIDTQKPSRAIADTDMDDKICLSDLLEPTSDISKGPNYLFSDIIAWRSKKLDKTGIAPRISSATEFLHRLALHHSCQDIA